MRGTSLATPLLLSDANRWTIEVESVQDRRSVCLLAVRLARTAASLNGDEHALKTTCLGWCTVSRL